METETSNNTKRIRSKVMSYGQEALGPLWEVVGKHKETLLPYGQSAKKALDGAIRALSEESASKQDRKLCNMLEDLRNKTQSLESQSMSASEFRSRIERITSEHPLVGFALSYAIGLIIGRGGRHVASDEVQSGTKFDEASDPRVSDSMINQPNIH